MSAVSTSSPTISVVIPARDRATQLPASLESVARQTVPVHEVIVVDDGSSDDTVEVARRMGATVLTHQTSRGSGEARNTGIRSASGDWIAFLDSDDQWRTDHVATFLEHVDDNILVSTSAVDSMGGRRGYVGTRVAKLDSRRCFVPETPVVTSGCFVRRDALIAAGLFRPFPRAQDLDMWARTLEHGPGIAVPAPTVSYVITETGMSNETRERNTFYMRQVAQSFEDRPWATKGFYRAIEARLDWDVFRRGTSQRDRGMAVPPLMRLLRRPGAWWDVARLILSRRGVEPPRLSRPPRFHDS